MIDTEIQTKTINLKYVNKVLSNCPNYDKIVNYDYEYGDTLSSKLIDWYRELIFSCNYDDNRQLSIISQIDRSLALYVLDIKYKKGLSNVLSISDVSVDNVNLIEKVIKKIIDFTNKYENEEILNLVNNRWL